MNPEIFRSTLVHTSLNAVSTNFATSFSSSSGQKNKWAIFFVSIIIYYISFSSIWIPGMENLCFLIMELYINLIGRWKFFWARENHFDFHLQRIRPVHFHSHKGKYESSEEGVGRKSVYFPFEYEFEFLVWCYMNLLLPLCTLIQRKQLCFPPRKRCK